MHAAPFAADAPPQKVPGGPVHGTVCAHTSRARAAKSRTHDGGSHRVTQTQALNMLMTPSTEPAGLPPPAHQTPTMHGTPVPFVEPAGQALPATAAHGPVQLCDAMLVALP